MGARESGEAFLKSVLTRIPEERRAAVEELLPDLADVIGEGVMAREDYSRGMDSIRAMTAEQTGWYTANKPLLELGQKAQAAGFVPGAPSPAAAPVLPDDVVRRGELDQGAKDFTALVAYASTLAVQHYHEFKEPLDVLALVNDPNVTKVGIKAVYEAAVAGKRAEVVAAATQAEIKRQVDEQVAARTKGMHNPSYPGPIGEDTSPLNALEPTPARGGSVDDLVDAYNTVRSGGSL